MWPGWQLAAVSTDTSSLQEELKVVEVENSKTW
jgi:hypothetical protein